MIFRLITALLLLLPLVAVSSQLLDHNSSHDNYDDGGGTSKVVVAEQVEAETMHPHLRRMHQRFEEKFSFVLEPNEIVRAFPSVDATVVGSSLTMTEDGMIPEGSLFIPPTLAELYPDFGGPHYVTEVSFRNDCKYGVDGVTLELPINTDGMLDENGTPSIGFTLSINGMTVADGVLYKNDDKISMKDVIYPPIMDPQLQVTMDVSSFDGTINSSILPSGAKLAIGMEETLILNCAPPFPTKGAAYKDAAIVPGKKKTLSKLSNKEFKKCDCRNWPLVLPDSARPGSIPPKRKLFQACHDRSLKSPFLPIPNEPFREITEPYREFFYVKDYKFIAEKFEVKDDKDDFIDPEALLVEVCGGRGATGTIRMTGCQCESKYVPEGYDPTDLTFDFDVYCPLEGEKVKVRLIAHTTPNPEIATALVTNFLDDNLSMSTFFRVEEATKLTLKTSIQMPCLLSKEDPKCQSSALEEHGQTTTLKETSRRKSDLSILGQ